MRFEPMTIDHLGLRLYSTLPPVISELVSNGYDAEAKRVEVTIPIGPINGNSEVTVRDFGHGMSAQEVATEYLPIGRCRRGVNEANKMSKSGIRRVTGRKGLGKLSAFGVATEMDVRAIHGGQAVCLRLNYDKIKEWVRDNQGRDFEPVIVDELTGTTSDDDGVIVTLRKFHRTRAINADEVRKGLAKRLSFIGSDFVVAVNENEVEPGDRFAKSQCAEGFSWDINDIPGGGVVSHGGKVVSGWIGFLTNSSQTERGVDIFAAGKAVELGSFFRLASTHAQFARAHLIGEIHADFLDDDQDLIATARNSVVWESEIGMELEQWGQKTLKWAFDQWIKLRKKEKQTKVIKAAAFDKWLDSRQPSEKRVAQRMVNLLVDDDNLDPLSVEPLLEIIKTSVEAVAFRELIEQIELEGISVPTLLRLFDEWRVIEAREHLRLADGRLSVIEKLEQFMRSGALEVQELQPLFDQNPWLIDTSWNQVDRQATYTKLLKRTFPESPKTVTEDRRLDLFAIRSGGGIAIVELKHPTKKLSKEDLIQIEDYVNWARDNIVGTGPDSPPYANGLLLVGSLNSKEKRRMERLAGADIRVETYSDLHTRSKEYYNFVDRALETTAPEYARSKRKRKVNSQNK